MKIISKANNSVLAILRKPNFTDNSVRMIHYCVEKELADGVLIFNSLTKELLLLTQDEYASRFDSQYLREHWFVVPKDTDERELSDMVRWVLTAQQPPKKNITGYTIFTTTDCNARCFYCFELGKKYINMSQDTAFKVAQYIKSHCGGEKITLHWFGGEPLYNAEVIDIICQELRDSGIEYTSKMISNAYLFDDVTVKKAVDLWNLESVQITLDGTEKIYNKIKAYIYKNTNAYKIVLNNIQNLIDASVFVHIRLNMDLYNAEDLLQLVQELSLKFGNHKKIRVYAHHIFKAGEAMSDIHSQEEWQRRDDAMIRLENAISVGGLSYRSGISKRVCLNHCMADSGNDITILPDGNIGLCEHHLDSEFIGHIEQDGFDMIAVESWKEASPPISECDTCFNYPDCIMLKKCTSDQKCYLQRRQGILRNTILKMINEYNIWSTDNDEE